jgi:hypothetical protein
MPNTGITASLNPRSDGIIIGNMQERGNWSLEPNPDVRQQNVDAAIQFCRAMRPPSVMDPSETDAVRLVAQHCRC